MSFKEKFANARALMGEIESFTDHIQPLKIKLTGDLLVIGPAADLIDLIVVEPHLGSISTLTLVDQDFRPERAYFLDIFKQCHPETRASLHQPQYFQDLSTRFNSIIFIGASAFTFMNNVYRGIPDRLTPGGIFYGTCNFAIPNETTNLTSDTIMKTISPLPKHPRWDSDWSGVIIEKAQH